MIEIKPGIKNLYIVGDIHGEFTKLVHDITYVHKLTDSVIIIAGDSGFWHYKPGYYERIWYRIKKRLEEKNNMILCVRGNHDNPWYYNPMNWKGYDRWMTLRDYEVYEILGQMIFCIGGATSIDQAERKDWNAKRERYGSSRRVWWITERPIQVPMNHLPNKIDIVISHDAPMPIGPVVYRTEEMDLDIYNNICEDRDYLAQVLLEMKPRYWYFGHYHKSFSGTFGDTLYKGLGIEEIIRYYGGED